MELLLYALALGFAAAVIVPLLYGFTAKILPTSITTGLSVPTTFPTSFQALGLSIVIWGIFLGLAIWALSYIPKVGRAVKREA